MTSAPRGTKFIAATATWQSPCRTTQPLGSCVLQLVYSYDIINYYMLSLRNADDILHDLIGAPAFEARMLPSVNPALKGDDLSSVEVIGELTKPTNREATPGLVSWTWRLK